MATCLTAACTSRTARSKALDPIALSGYGFYVVHRNGHPKAASIKAFIAWICAMV